MSRATDLKIVRVLTADASAAAATFQANFALPETRSSNDAGVTTKALRIGAAEIEMTSPAGADSALAKVLAERGAGLHELVLEVDDLDRARADFAERGIDVVITSGADGRRRGSIAPAHTHGVHIQLIAR